MTPQLSMQLRTFTDDADHDIDQQTLAVALDDLTRQPARNGADDDCYDKTHALPHKVRPPGPGGGISARCGDGDNCPTTPD